MQWISLFNHIGPKFRNRKTSPCSPRAPNLLHVLPSRMVVWNEICNPALNVPLFDCIFAHQLPNFLDLWRRELAEELVVCRCRPRGERLSYHRSRRAPQTFYPGMIVTMLLFYCFDLVLICFDVILICSCIWCDFIINLIEGLNFIGLALWIPSTQFL